MKALRAVRYISWALIAITIGVIGTTLLDWKILDRHEHARDSLPQSAMLLGGPFTMVDHTGRTVTEKNFLGRPFVVFFGFTHCPDICPTTLSWLSDLVEKAVPEGDGPRIIFVTVDPERDTVDVLSNYIGSFGSGIVGLTGSLDQVTEMAKAWKVYFKKAPLESGGYTMDHTSSIILMDKEGKFRGTLDLHDATPDNNLKKLAKLIREN